MNLRNCALLLVALVIPTLGAAEENSAFNGIYGGAGFGGSFTTSEMDSDATGFFDFRPNGFLTEPGFSSTNDAKNDALKASLFAGYGYSWKRLYLGAEVFVNFSDNDMSTSDTGGILNPVALGSDMLFENNLTMAKNSVSLNTTEYGVDLLPGFLLTPNTLLYGRVGLAINELSIKTVAATQDTFANVEPFLPESHTQNLSSSESKTRAFLRLGAGLEQRITEHLAIRADYIYTYYGKISINDSVTSFEPFSEILQNTGQITLDSNADAEVANNTVMLSLAYYLSEAQTSPAPKWFTSETDSDFNGLYAGVAGGGSFTTAKNDIAANNSSTFFHTIHGPLTFETPYDTHGASKDNSLKGDLYAGYGQSWNRFYLGTEIFVSFSETEMQESGNGGLHTFENVPQEILNSHVHATKTKLEPVEYGIDLRPGLLLTPSTLLYARVGVAINEVSLETSTTGNIEFLKDTFPNPESFPLTLNTSDTKDVAALRLGAGLEQRLGEHLAVRADYIYTRYPTISSNESVSQTLESVNFLDGLHTVSNDTSAELSNSTILLGISYYFD